jgi:hypothetical protein
MVASDDRWQRCHVCELSILLPLPRECPRCHITLVYTDEDEIPTEPMASKHPLPLTEPDLEE